MKPDREPVRLHDEVEALIQRQWTVPLALLLLLLWLGVALLFPSFSHDIIQDILDVRPRHVFGRTRHG